MREQYWQYIIDLYNDIPEWVYEGLVSVFCLGAVLMLAFYGFKKGLRYSLGLLLVEYVLLLFCSTVIFRVYNESERYNFHPFWSYERILNGEGVVSAPDLVMNVLVFVPVGVLFGMATSRRIHRDGSWKKGWLSALLVGAGISIGIESLQFFFKKGFSEFDDVMHNTLGCIMGYGIYTLTRQLCGCLLGKNESSPNN